MVKRAENEKKNSNDSPLVAFEDEPELDPELEPTATTQNNGKQSEEVITEIHTRNGQGTRLLIVINRLQSEQVNKTFPTTEVPFIKKYSSPNNPQNLSPQQPLQNYLPTTTQIPNPSINKQF